MYGNVWRSSEGQHFVPEFCTAIISLCDSLDEQQGKVLGGEDRSVRNNAVFAVDDPEFKEVVLYMMRVANKDWNFDISGIENLQLSKYGPGQKYGWHIDMLPGDPMRKLTFNLVLNQDFEGGEFQFSWGSPSAPYRKRVIKETAFETPGCFIVFPSYYYHRVTEVTSGTRYSLTGWAVGPPFR